MATKQFIQQLAFNRVIPSGRSFFPGHRPNRAREVQSEFNVWYLDDASFGDEPAKVLADLENVISRLTKIGLEINGGKCELTIPNLHHRMTVSLPKPYLKQYFLILRLF